MIKKLSLFLGMVSSLSFAQSTTKPNILFIAVDDLKPTINCFGDSYAQTPNFDRIATNGTVFLNNQCQWSVCGPSRSSLLTGKRPDYTKVWDLQTLIRDMNPNIVTLPQYFKNNGYAVVGGGKIFDTRSVDSGHDAISWTSTFKSPNAMPFNTAYGKPFWGYYQTKAIKDEGALMVAQYGSIAAAEDHYKPAYEIGVAADGSSIPDDAYNDGAAAKWAVSQLNTLKTSTSPFFLAVGFKNPHLPFSCPKKYYDLYDKNTISLAEYRGRGTDIPEISMKGSNELASYPTPGLTVTPDAAGGYTISDDDQKTLLHAYYANVSYIDEQIGKLLDKLQSTGLASNTIVVVWGDHGWHLGDHKMWGKHSNLENATYSPLMIYDPRNPSTVKTTNAPTEHLDIYPTLCKMAGLPVPNDMDGVDLNPLMTGAKTSVKEFAVSQFQSMSKYGYSFKNERYRYTVWLNGGKKATDKPTTADYFVEELYDFVEDPNETTNVLNDVNYAAVRTDIATKVQNYFQNGAGIVTPPAAIPLALNANFETAPFATNWTFTAVAPAIGTLSDAGVSGANAGNSAAKVTVTTAGANDNTVRLQNTIFTSDLSGKTIRIKLAAKSQSGTEQFKIRLYTKSNGIVTYPVTAYIKPTTVYADYTADFVIPANTTELRVDLLCGKYVGTYYFDDIVVTEVAAATPQVNSRDITVITDVVNNTVSLSKEGLITSASLYDFNGKQIQGVTVVDNKVNVSLVPSGIYNLVLQIDGGEVITKKIIVKH